MVAELLTFLALAGILASVEKKLKKKEASKTKAERRNVKYVRRKKS